MLHNALGECVSYQSPNLPKVISSITKTLIPWAQPQICTPVYTLLSDVGPVSVPDLSLAACLNQQQLTYTSTASPTSDGTNDSLKLFPVACACLFGSERWESAVYNYDLEAFERNEHTSMIAASALMVGFFVGDSSGGQTGTDNGASASTVRTMTDTFLRLSSQLLLTLRSAETTQYNTRPLRSMCTLIETFLVHHEHMCAHAQAQSSDVEKYFPYSLMHSCLMEISLGKQREVDSLKAFTSSDASSTPRNSMGYSSKDAVGSGADNAFNTAESAV
jgi:hypothetical protein